MFKLILFDLGGVVFTNGTKKFVADMGARYNLPLAEITDVIDGDLGTKYREGEITRNEFWQQLLSRLNLKQNADELEAEWIGDYALIVGTKDIILRLKDKYKVMYLSDNVKERADKLNKQFGFMDWFSGGIFSHEVGVRKPDPKIYQYALDKAGCKPEETIFIDDKAVNLEPARAMGITPLLFASPEQLETELAKLGL